MQCSLLRRTVLFVLGGMLGLGGRCGGIVGGGGIGVCFFAFGTLSLGWRWRGGDLCVNKCSANVLLRCFFVEDVIRSKESEYLNVLCA